MAMAGQHQAAKIMSKDLVRQRNQVNQYTMMSSQLKSMQMQMASMESQQAIMQALGGSTQVMKNINENMDIAQIREVLKDFNKEMGKADMNGEMMGDAMDMMADPSEAADADDVYNGIMGEIGLDYNKESGTVANKSIAKKEEVVEEVKEENDELEARLAALRM
mmetsp:Transcript_2157/g.1494  ORF Transcript_2157/g.1494 Transcript_2157/m.1494 type:complete len:164 (-) Transcript_2157:76-567(-)|eukprot:CAMPEP_0116876490 /NCGR_PEP_ID=MMETSP0463-20121206/8414_1 /TAXON_ID=181622 /ORGANISM="Strombidinopsis sp, Strain SopsisLIS2011" /LENGTH=163 /DNA_ID=CAMNT_0004523111 /DNA_START=156 /DNA_END=647 /DNA_ORIENTATION=-